MMKIGIVDLDTSHAAAWIPIERAMGAEIVGVWDGGSVHPEGYAEEFAHMHRIERVFATLEAMAERVDLAILLGCDWDQHLAKAKVFVDAGKAVLIDKPIAGSLEDLCQMAAWAKGGARIFGGSSHRYAPNLLEWKALPACERGEPHTVLSGCAMDEFYYGIHAYTTACAVMGAGVSHARWVSDTGQQRVELRWPDGRIAWVVVGEQTGGWMPFYSTVVTERGVTQLQPKSPNLHQSFFETVWPWLSGATAQPPCKFEELIAPERAALAGLRSQQLGGEEVALADVDASIRYDGASFARGYRERIRAQKASGAK